MLVMLPSSMRKDRGVAFVAALPLIPQHAPLDVVELRPDGSLHDVVTLNPSGVDALHDTTRPALKAATREMQRTARDLERFAIRPGVTLAEAVRSVRQMRANVSGSPETDRTPVASKETLAQALAKIGAVLQQLEIVTESVEELRQMLRATSRDRRATSRNRHENTTLGTVGYLLEQSRRHGSESAEALRMASELSVGVPHAWRRARPAVQMDRRRPCQVSAGPPPRKLASEPAGTTRGRNSFDTGDRTWVCMPSTIDSLIRWNQPQLPTTCWPPRPRAARPCATGPYDGQGRHSRGLVRAPPYPSARARRHGCWPPGTDAARPGAPRNRRRDHGERTRM